MNAVTSPVTVRRLRWASRLVLCLVTASAWGFAASPWRTVVGVDGDRWLVNGSPTNPGAPAEGLLLNARMVQATFEDTNPATVELWSYPDGRPYDPDRQTDEFVAMVPTYAAVGLDAVTISLQGGRPRRGAQVWRNGAFEPDGSLRAGYLARVARVVEALDEHGMVAILSYFYFGQDDVLEDEAAVVLGAEAATDWVLAQGYTNVLIEVVNEAGHPDYDHAAFAAERVHELVEAVKRRADGRLLVSASLGGGEIPSPRLVAVSDFHLLHGNGQSARRVAAMVDDLRRVATYRGAPIVFNEDSTELANFLAAVGEGASWGYYDQGTNDYRSGFQSPPTDWGPNTPEKQAFFDLVRELSQPEGAP